MSLRLRIRIIACAGLWLITATVVGATAPPPPFYPHPLAPLDPYLYPEPPPDNHLQEYGPPPPFYHHPFFPLAQEEEFQPIEEESTREQPPEAPPEPQVTPTSSTTPPPTAPPPAPVHQYVFINKSTEKSRRKSKSRVKQRGEDEILRFLIKYQQNSEQLISTTTVAPQTEPPTPLVSTSAPPPASVEAHPQFPVFPLQFTPPRPQFVQIPLFAAPEPPNGVALEEEVGLGRDYSYGYAVDSPQTLDHKSAREWRSGGVVHGVYSLLQPDGVVRTVTYSAHPRDGFHAQVDNKYP